MKKLMAIVVLLTVALAFCGGLFISQSQADPCKNFCTTINGCTCCQHCCGKICTQLPCWCIL